MAPAAAASRSRSPSATCISRQPVNLLPSSLSLSTWNMLNLSSKATSRYGLRIADAIDVHLRAVRPAAEHGPGPQHGRPAAVGAFDVVVVVAGGDVEPAVVADVRPET